jgi:hypothetical protein
VPAKLQMNWASASGISTCRNAADGRPAVPASATSHLPPHESGRHSTAGHAEYRVGVLAPASGPQAFLPVDYGLGAGNGLHPMEVISPGRWNVPPWEGIGRLLGLASPSAPQLLPARDPLALPSDSVSEGAGSTIRPRRRKVGFSVGATTLRSESEGRHGSVWSFSLPVTRQVRNALYGRPRRREQPERIWAAHAGGRRFDS